MIKLATCAQMLELDKEAIEKYGVSGMMLMENAARSVFERCKELEAYKRKKVVIFCGTGNNGGDGFALARLMVNDGAKVTIVLVGDSRKIAGDAKSNYDICVKMGIDRIELGADGVRAEEYSPLVIDALLGTGVTGGLREEYAKAVSLINGSGAFVASIDCPTGGNPDTGEVLGECVKADITVSIALLKQGLLLYPLADYTGKLEIGQIGAPKAVFDNFDSGVYALDMNSASEMLPKRYSRSHKGTYGKAAIIAGSQGMAGAAAYCAKAAYAAGCGYVNICAPLSIVPLVQTLAPQAVITVMPEKDGRVCESSLETALETVNKATVCLIGPGLGNTADTQAFVKGIIKSAETPLILDADALNAIAGEPEILKAARFTPIITPHPREMSRLTGRETSYILSRMPETAAEFSKKYNAAMVLKDTATIVCTAERTFINKCECPALAKAGSGDVLAGMMAGLAAQGIEEVKAAALAVYLHGLAGVAASEKFGEYSVTSDGLIDCIGSVIMKVKGRRI